MLYNNIGLLLNYLKRNNNFDNKDLINSIGFHYLLIHYFIHRYYFIYYALKFGFYFFILSAISDIIQL